MDFDEQKICACALCRPHELNRRDGQLEPDAAADRWHPVAEGFAQGKRCANRHPTLARAEISKQHTFGVFLSWHESELV